MHHRINIDEKFRMEDTVQVTAKVQTEAQEMMLREMYQMVKNMEDLLKKSERNGKINAIIGALLGFALGKISSFMGF